MIDPSLTQTNIADRMGVDFKSASRLFEREMEWVSEEKLDRLLTAFHCNHLWMEPPLDEVRLALLEYESLTLEDAALAA